MVKSSVASAPVIKIPADATEYEHLALLGLLNSSNACFWMKQVSQKKQMTAGDSIRIESIAKVPHEFAGTQLQKLPLPPKWQTSSLRIRLIDLARKVDELAQQLTSLTALRSIEEGLASGENLRKIWQKYVKKRTQIRSQLIFLQEEIDFVCYCFYEIGDLSLLAPDPLSWNTSIDAGDRPFCILKQENQEGFSVPPGIPHHWSKELQELWKKRISAVEQSKSLKIIEDPHYKRRWIGQQGKFNHAVNTDELEPGCESWLLDRLETYFDFDGRMNDDGKPTSKIDNLPNLDRKTRRHRPPRLQLPASWRTLPQRLRL